MEEKGYKMEEEKGWLLPVVLIWTAYAITCFVSIATVFSMGWHVTSTTGDPVVIAAVSVCALLPQGLLAPLGGVAADTFNRKKILLLCYVVIAAAGLIVAGVIMAGSLSLPVILAFSLVMGVRNGFRDPAFNALMPMLVPEKHLIRINMLDNLLMAASMILAPALGILLYTSFGLSAPLLALAVGSLLSMLTLATVSVPTLAKKTDSRVRDEFAGGFRVLAGHRGMFILVSLFVVGLMAYGPFDNLLPLLVATVFDGDGYAASMCEGAFGVGMLVGSACLMAIGERVPLSRVIAGCAVALGASMLACSLLPSNQFPLLVVCAVLAGACCAGFAGPATTLLQKNCDPKYLGRVMGIFNSAMALGMPLGTAVGGAIAAFTGVQAFVLFDGAAMVVIGVMALMSREMRGLDKADASQVAVAVGVSSEPCHRTGVIGGAAHGVPGGLPGTPCACGRRDWRLAGYACTPRSRAAALPSRVRFDQQNADAY